MKIQLLSSDGNTQYLVTQRQEIIRLLRGVMLARTMIAVYWDPHHDPALSSLVAVDPAKDELILERGPSAFAADNILASQQITCATVFERVHIQFASGRPKTVLHEGTPCLRLDFPRELLRMQRREYYRLTTSVINPVKCLLNQNERFEETVVVDISVGGVGILALGEGVELKSGEIFHGCRIALPNSGEYALSLRVCSTFELTLKNGKLSHRAGCQFIDLPPSVETEIQRYVNRVERERRSRYF